MSVAGLSIFNIAVMCRDVFFLFCAFVNRIFCTIWKAVSRELCILCTQLTKISVTLTCDLY